jgi:hypothetical protein
MNETNAYGESKLAERFKLSNVPLISVEGKYSDWLKDC